MLKADRQREQQTTGRGAFVPLVFAAGEAFQFDWSEDWAVIAGERTKLQVTLTKLSHSRAFIVRAYLLQTHEMLFDALAHAFRVLGGVPQRGIFDNMKTAVDKIGSGKARQVNARFIERSHKGHGRTVYDWRHYLAVIQRKPGALRNGAPFAELPDAFRQLQGQLLKRPGGDREMVEILALVLQHDEQAVLCAVELALEAGVATKTHVINVLHRLTDGKVPPAPPLDAPQALRLTREPVANVERYDDLRDRGARHAS